MAIRTNDNETSRSLSMCVEDVARIFMENGLFLGPTKTDERFYLALRSSEKIFYQRTALYRCVYKKSELMLVGRATASV